MNRRRLIALALAGLGGALLGGCSTFRREAPRPGRTTLDSPLVILPAQRLGTYLVVEGKWDRGGPWRFLVDTGANTTLVTPEFAKRYGVKDDLAAPAAPVEPVSPCIP